MPKEKLPFVIPIGGESGATRDGRLVTGVTGMGRALSISDGRVAMPGGWHSGRSGRGGAGGFGRLDGGMDMPGAWVAVSGAQQEAASSGAGAGGWWGTPLASDAACYLCWSFQPGEYDDVDVWGVVVSTGGSRLSPLGSPPSGRPFYYPSQENWALWLNQEDTDGTHPTTDTADVPFAFNERNWLRYDTLPATAGRIYYGATVQTSGWQAEERLDAVHDIAFVIRVGRTIRLLWGALDGYEAEQTAPNARTVMMGYFDVATRAWVEEVATSNETMTTYIQSRWPL